MTKKYERHGMCSTPEYRRWSHMIERCTNPNDDSWKNYGGRTDPGPVTVCDRWRDSFLAFYEDIQTLGPRPSPQHTIDRIDNDGNYEPGNIRWADRFEQARNRRHKSSSEYHGVYWEKSKGKWHVQIKVDGRERGLGYFDDEKRAARRYDRLARELRGRGPWLNFPGIKYVSRA
jgi:hypothetical protein